MGAGRGRGVGNFVLLVLTMLIGAGSVLAIPTVSPQSASPNAATGETIQVDLAVDGVENLYAYQFEVSYDPAQLTFVKLVPGAILNQQGAETFTMGVDTSTAGVIKNIVETRTGDVPGVTGSGPLVSLLFRAIAPGNTMVTLRTASLVDGAVQQIPHTIGQPLTLQLSGTAVQQPAQYQSQVSAPAQTVPQREQPTLLTAPPASPQADDSTFLWLLLAATVLAVCIAGYAMLKVKQHHREPGKSLGGNTAAGYVQQMRTQGYADSAIAQQLRKSGWTEAQVGAAMGK